jgi:aminoglycoside 6'-N-acetyltransferase
VRLRPASPADAGLLRYWDTKPHVAAATGADPAADWDAELALGGGWLEHLIAEVDGRPVGIVQILDPARDESRYWGDVAADLRAVDIWIGEAADLGRGFGTAMMRLALLRCFADPAVKAVLLDPLATNTRAHRFYERLGFRAIERRRFGDDDCIVYRLERAAWSGGGVAAG